jgi:peptidoglycan-associated lipoprotein
LFLSVVAGLAVTACGGTAKKDDSPFTQKADVIKREKGEIPDDPDPSGRTRPADAALPTEPIYFDFDTAAVRDDSRATLARYAEYLKKNPKVTVTIAGHTDERGTTEYNLALGDQRAKAARDYLARLGVDVSRIEVTTFGEERPADPGSGESSWSRNRRAELDISGNP